MKTLMKSMVQKRTSSKNAPNAPDQNAPNTNGAWCENKPTIALMIVAAFLVDDLFAFAKEQPGDAMAGGAFFILMYIYFGKIEPLLKRLRELK